jgi:hypothetical protein
LETRAAAFTLQASAARPFRLTRTDGTDGPPAFAPQLPAAAEYVALARTRLKDLTGSDTLAGPAAANQAANAAAAAAFFPPGVRAGMAHYPPPPVPEAPAAEPAAAGTARPQPL